MIFEHEIPSGSHLYFGSSAKLKRKIEHDSAMILEDAGYQEMITPLFSYHQNESFGSSQALVRINDMDNYEVSLRADSTADIVRIVTNRLGRSSDQKRWFYIQPIFTFPTTEQYQIGAELIDGSFNEVCNMSMALLEKQEIRPLFQMANIAIPKLLNEKYSVSLDDITSMNIQALVGYGLPWMESLVNMHKVEDLADLSMFPDDIANELQKIATEAKALEYSQIVISPLYYAQLKYYDSLLFRIFEDNKLFATGGIYTIDEIKASGFALYTDRCIEKLTTKGKDA